MSYIRDILIAAFLALIFRAFCFEPYVIPSGSMLPTLHIGDYVLVTKYSYGYSRASFLVDLPFIKGRIFSSEPKRGDIAVFQDLKGPNRHYIKRLIGLPGDKVQMRQGALYVNGVKIEKELELEDASGLGYEISSNSTPFSLYSEELDGKNYSIAKKIFASSSAFPRSTAVYEVPQGHYFLLGDNRDFSLDSRYLNGIGFVPEENLVGRADWVVWSKDFSFSAWFNDFSTGRAFKSIYQ